MLEDRFINLFTDFGFKKIFGEEPNKDLLISFLNALLKGEQEIEDLQYLKNERLGLTNEDRNAVFDLYCTNVKGDRFIVEVQRAKQKYFKDRSLFYASHAIQDQAQKGKSWMYELRSVYTISLLDFIFDEEDLEKVTHRVKLTELESNKIFYDKLSFIYLEIPKFTKSLNDIESDFERWLYAFKNLHTLKDKPVALRDGIFERLMELAEIAKMDTQEKLTYKESLKNYRDMLGVKEAYVEEGFEKGRVEGREEGREEGERKRELEIVQDMLAGGFSVEQILKFSKLTRNEIEQLKEDKEK